MLACLDGGVVGVWWAWCVVLGVVCVVLVRGVWCGRVGFRTLSAGSACPV